MKLSVVILAKNEEQNISAVISSAKRLFLKKSEGEIVVIDDNSSDKTVSLAKEDEAKVYKHRLNNDFASQRNYGLSKAKGEWVLFLDADERLTQALAIEIRRNIKIPHMVGFNVRRQDLFLGKKMKGGEWGNTILLRLARKGSGKWERKVHEVWKIKGQTSALSSALPHFGRNNLSEFLAKLNFYAKLHAESNRTEGKNPDFVKILVFPFFKFINNFMFKKAYRDRTHGFVYSVFMSFHSFLAWSQLWISKEHKT